MSAAPALRLARLGELEERGPGVGFMVYRPDPGRCFELTSYNPRRFADSRRWWAKLKREQMDAAPATSLLTLTLPAEFHEHQIDRATVAHETRAVRRFVQTLTRLVARIDAGDVCWTCLRDYRERVRSNPRARFSPCRSGRRPAHRKPWHGAIGNCARCARWTHVRWYPPELELASGEARDPHGAWLCNGCAGGRPPGRRPRLRMAWVREPGSSLRHLHRHAKFDGPYIPQWLLSELADRAGLGRVLDVRRFRAGPAMEPQAPLSEYLTKTSATRALDPLSSYFVKAAARPDEFNALPKGIPRCRAPRPPRPSSDWYFSRHDPRAAVSSPPRQSAGLVATLARVSPRLFVCGPAGVAVVRKLRPPGCVCLSEWDCRCGSMRDNGARAIEASPAALAERYFAQPSQPDLRVRDDFGMLSASSQAVPREERGAVSEACGSREAIDSSAFQFMTETKERLELLPLGRARAPD